MSASPIHSHDPDFARLISRTFERGRFLLKMRRAGYLIVYIPFAKLYRHEAESDQTDAGAEQIFCERWADVLQGDPYYNPNLSRERAGFTLGI